MRSYKIAEAARLLGVSDDTLRRWVEQELARAADDPTDVLSSARNRFVGLVTRVQIDGLMAQLDIQAGPHRVVSLLSAEAVHEMQLEVGSLAVAVVKATNVIVEAPRE